MDESRRRCNTCDQLLPLTEFGEYKIKGRAGKGRRRKCKRCRVAETSQRYRDNPEVKAAMQDRARKHHFAKSYGLSLDELQAMVDRQEGRCAICERWPTSTLNVDHCHSTGEIRGLLCWHCNVGLGKFEDNVLFLKSAIKYLGGDLSMS